MRPEAIMYTSIDSSLCRQYYLVHKYWASCLCFAGLRWYLSDVCRRMLTYVHICWQMLTYDVFARRRWYLSDICRRMLMYADECWRMLTNADECWRMLTLADACSVAARWKGLPSWVRGHQGKYAGRKAQGNFTWRLLTFADVCWRMLTGRKAQGNGSWTAECGVAERCWVANCSVGGGWAAGVAPQERECFA